MDFVALQIMTVLAAGKCQTTTPDAPVVSSSFVAGVSVENSTVISGPKSDGWSTESSDLTSRTGVSAFETRFPNTKTAYQTTKSSLLTTGKGALLKTTTTFSTAKDIFTTPSTTPDPYLPTCPLMSCAGMCGQKLDVNTIYCSCHFTCTAFRECCPDYTRVCGDYRLNTTGQTEVNVLPREVCGDKGCYTCTTHSRFHNLDYFFSVSRCPVDFPENEIKQRCTQIDEDRLVEVVPFLTIQGVAYRNIYCAICHRIPPAELSPLPYEIGCDFDDQSVNYFSRIPFENITISELLNKRCNVKIEGQQNTTFAHPYCVRMNIESCPIGHPLADLCDAVYEPYRITNFLKPSYIARNRFCMACGPKDGSRATCWTRFDPGGITTPVTIGTFRFSVLFDYSSLYHDQNDNDVSIINDDGDKPTASVLAQGQGFGLMSSQHETLVATFLGTLSQNTIDISYAMFNVQHYFPTLNNVTFFTSSRQSSSAFSNDSLPWVSDFNITGYLYSGAKRYEDVEYTFLSGIEQLSDLNELFSLSKVVLSNLYRPINTICLTLINVYSSEKFANVTNKKKEASPESDNYTTNVSVIKDWFRIPFEIIWIPEPYCGLNQNRTNQSCVESLHTKIHVCGDSAEINCSLVTYPQDYVLGLLKENEITELTKSFRTVLYSDGQVTLCSEELQNIRSAAVSNSGDLVEFILTAVCCTVSLVCLLATFITYVVFKDLRNLPGKCVMTLVSAMFTAQLLFVIGGLVGWRDSYLCQVIAVLQHFFWLATFSWTNVMAYDLGHTFGSKGQIRKSPAEVNKEFLIYSLVGWSLPAAVVICCVCINYFSTLSLGYGQNNICWITVQQGLLFAFIVPVAIHMVFNIVSFAFVVCSIHKTNALTKDAKTSQKTKRSTLVIYARISAVMCFTWLVGYLSIVVSVTPLWYAFTVLNATQGLYLLIAFVLTPKVVAMYVSKCGGCFGARAIERSSSSSSTTRSSRL